MLCIHHAAIRQSQFNAAPTGVHRLHIGTGVDLRATRRTSTQKSCSELHRIRDGTAIAQQGSRSIDREAFAECARVDKNAGDSRDATCV